MNEEQQRRALPVVAEGRSCGNCTECCKALRVDELEKKDYERCSKLGRYGCGIYSKRPDGCRAYACMWLQGLGGRELRPDRLGVVFSHMWSEKLGEHVLVHEMKPRALESPQGRMVLAAIGGQRIMFLVRRDSRLRLLGGPPELVRASIEAARERGVLQQIKAESE